MEGMPPLTQSNFGESLLLVPVRFFHALLKNSTMFLPNRISTITRGTTIIAMMRILLTPSSPCSSEWKRRRAPATDGLPPAVRPNLSKETLIRTSGRPTEPMGGELGARGRDSPTTGKEG